MTSSAPTNVDIHQVLSERIAELRELSFNEVVALPETMDERRSVNDHRFQTTIFRQKLNDQEFLVVVQISTSRLLGLVAGHIERGLVFRSSSVRDATETELLSTGG